MGTESVGVGVHCLVKTGIVYKRAGSGLLLNLSNNNNWVSRRQYCSTEVPGELQAICNEQIIAANEGDEHMQLVTTVTTVWMYHTVGHDF